MVFVLSSNDCAKSLSMNFLCKDMRSTIILSPDIKLSFMTPNKYAGFIEDSDRWQTEAVHCSGWLKIWGPKK